VNDSESAAVSLLAVEVNTVNGVDPRLTTGHDNESANISQLSPRLTAAQRPALIGGGYDTVHDLHWKTDSLI